MHFLRVLTKKETTGDGFLVYWTNSTAGKLKGALHVLVPAGFEDRNIVAELFAIQYLLEVRSVLGDNLAGSEKILLVVSLGAIKKLSRKASAKRYLVGYAKFLTTRFNGCAIKVDKDEEWIGDGCDPEETIDAAHPIEEMVYVHGFGNVLVTAHVIERFAQRSQIKRISDAWRRLRKVAAEQGVCEIKPDRPIARLKYAMAGKQEGRYFLHPERNLVMVVTHNRGRHPALVTIYHNA